MDKLRKRINEKIAEVARHYIDIERLAIIAYIHDVADNEANSNKEKALRYVAEGIKNKEHNSIDLALEKDPDEDES